MLRRLTRVVSLAFIGMSIGTGHAGLDDGLVAHYRFENNAQDASGNGNHGAASREVIFIDDSEQGAVASFDGSAWIDVPDAESLDTYETVSAFVWMKSEKTQQAIMAKRTTDESTGDRTGWMLSLRDDDTPGEFKVAIGTGRGSFRDFDSNVNVADGHWHHVGFTWNDASNTIRLYVDGSVVKEGTLGEEMIGNDAPLTLGWSSTHLYPEGRFVGLMADVRVYNYALSAADVRSLCRRVDDDNNGLSDNWERFYFGSTGTDPNEDADHDGYSNWVEFHLGTDPGEVESVLRISDPMISPGSAILTTDTEPNVIYNLLRSTDLSNWDIVSSIFPSSAGTGILVDSPPVIGDGYFYRIEAEIPRWDMNDASEFQTEYTNGASDADVVLEDGMLKLITTSNTMERTKIQTHRRYTTGRFKWRVFVPAYQPGDYTTMGAFLLGDQYGHEIDFEVGYGTEEMRQRIAPEPSAGELLAYTISQQEPRWINGGEEGENKPAIVVQADEWHIYQITVTLTDGEKVDHSFGEVYHVVWLIDGVQVDEKTLQYGPAEFQWLVMSSVENNDWFGSHEPEQDNYALFDYICIESVD